MLKQRIITALVLLAILLPALFYPSPVPFAAVVLVLMAGGAWEWGRLNGCGRVASVAVGAVCVAMCAASWLLGLVDQPLDALWLAAGAFGCWAVPGFCMPACRAGRGFLVRCGWWRGCWRCGWPGWLWCRRAPMGINFLLSVMTLVWMADIAAYFAGRAFGLRFTRNKLAPSISPGKSWEGVWGGVAGVLVLAVCWVVADARLQAPVASLYTRLATQGWWLLVLGALFMAAMSVVGDLIESLIKRSAGVKDSSNLLPGHGGVLDRVDALLPTLPLAMMLMTLVKT